MNRWKTSYQKTFPKVGKMREKFKSSFAGVHPAPWPIQGQVCYCYISFGVKPSLTQQNDSSGHHFPVWGLAFRAGTLHMTHWWCMVTQSDKGISIMRPKLSLKLTEQMTGLFKSGCPQTPLIEHPLRSKAGTEATSSPQQLSRIRH